jgi:outer membrane protease
VITLPYQGITVQIVIADIQLIGAMRIGLSGSETQNERSTLKELNFRQTFNFTDRTLAQTVNINLELTKVSPIFFSFCFGKVSKYKGWQNSLLSIHELFINCLSLERIPIKKKFTISTLFYRQ